MLEIRPAPATMKRKIVDFHLDEFNDWVADLDCGHGQHVRHNPPFTNRPWVIEADLRQQKVGIELNCLKCEQQVAPIHD